MDLILTGEGSFDEQSLYGKLPIQVATLAHENKIPVFILDRKSKNKRIKTAPKLQNYRLYPCRNDTRYCYGERCSKFGTSAFRRATIDH